MKKTSTLLAFIALASCLTAQNLQSITLLPANPTSADTVKVVAELAFTSGGCDLQSSYSAINGNQIDVEVKHCTGLLTVICYATDTVTIGTLQPGSYSLNFSAQTGSYDFNGNCTNFLPGGQQSIQFQVAGSTALPLVESNEPVLLADQEKRQFVLIGTDSPCRLQLIDLTGRTVFLGTAYPGPVPVHQPVHQGVYMYRLSASNGSTLSGRLLLR